MNKFSWPHALLPWLRDEFSILLIANKYAYMGNIIKQIGEFGKIRNIDPTCHKLWCWISYLAKMMKFFAIVVVDVTSFKNTLYSFGWTVAFYSTKPTTKRRRWIRNSVTSHMQDWYCSGNAPLNDQSLLRARPLDGKMTATAIDKTKLGYAHRHTFLSHIPLLFIKHTLPDAIRLDCREKE